MALANPQLSAFQAGVESTAGTAVAATAKLGITEFTATPEDNMEIPQIARGLVWESQGYEITSRRGVTWRARGPANLAELQSWFGMAILHDAAPAGAGPYTWTHTWDPTAQVPTSIATRTFERRLTDGTNNVDDEWAYAVCNELMISFTDGLLSFEAGGFARRRQASTLTAGQSLTAPDFEPSLLSIVDIDATWANLGTTNIAGQVLSWELRVRNGARPVFTADGRTDLDFTSHVLDGRNAGLELRMRLAMKADSGQFATERTAAEAATLRAVQIQVSGAGNEDLTLKLLGRHAAGSLDVVSEDAGLVVTDVVLRGSTDATNALEAVLINDVSALAW